jgi:hypothetical protein
MEPYRAVGDRSELCALEASSMTAGDVVEFRFNV